MFVMKLVQTRKVSDAGATATRLAAQRCLADSWGVREGKRTPQAARRATGLLK
ncbi:hypothetical protein VCH24_45610 [Variovorax boronicumulans]|nr:hypothetical protein VCH24_45610 [Variovorax boronicumulans]